MPYEKVVDRLLASPRYGEQMAVPWLDYARYADSHGYQSDPERFMWHWRDWVINAYNKNMPFDEFTIEQLAGDLLPNATTDQKIATGFNRNHRINGEGGIIAEEWRIEGVVDCVETTSETWLGLTMGCCRCHDHKFDPITQKEFYSFAGFFNSIAETGGGDTVAIDRGANVPPVLKLGTPEQLAKINDLTVKLDGAKAKIGKLDKDFAKLLEAWEKEGATKADPYGLAAEFPLDGKYEGRRVISNKKQFHNPYAGSEVLRRTGSNVEESGSSEYLRTGVTKQEIGDESTMKSIPAELEGTAEPIGARGSSARRWNWMPARRGERGERRCV